MEKYKRVLIAGMLSEMKAILHELDIDYLVVGPIKKDTSFKKHKFEHAGENKKIHMTISCENELKTQHFKNALVDTGKYCVTPQSANALFYVKGIELNVLHRTSSWNEEVQTSVSRNVFVMRAACLEKTESAVDKIFHRTS